MPIDNIKRAEKYLYNGNIVHVEHKINSLKALVCDNEARELTDNYFEVRISELKPLNKARAGIKTKPISKEKKTEKQIMNEFFESLYDGMSFLCMECNKPFHAFTNVAKKSACAHILPKSNFESVKTNPDNIIYLGASYIGQCGCHDFYDASVENRVKMKIYPYVLRQFKKLIPCLTNEELIDAYKYLGVKISAEILQEIHLK